MRSSVFVKPKLYKTKNLFSKNCVIGLALVMDLAQSEKKTKKVASPFLEILKAVCYGVTTFNNK